MHCHVVYTYAFIVGGRTMIEVNLSCKTDDVDDDGTFGSSGSGSPVRADDNELSLEAKASVRLPPCDAGWRNYRRGDVKIRQVNH